jgi:hypothetical protein
MTTPNTTPSPTQRVEQDWENHFDPDYSINGFSKDYVAQLATELESVQCELSILRNYNRAAEEQTNLRQQLADKTRECEELDAVRKIILDHIGYATVTQNTIKEIIAENAELKKDKERWHDLKTNRPLRSYSQRK